MVGYVQRSDEVVTRHSGPHFEPRIVFQVLSSSNRNRLSDLVSTLGRNCFRLELISVLQDILTSDDLDWQAGVKTMMTVVPQTSCRFNEHSFTRPFMSSDPP